MTVRPQIIFVVLAVFGVAGCGDPEPKIPEGQSIRNPIGDRPTGAPSSDPAERAKKMSEDLAKQNGK